MLESQENSVKKLEAIGFLVAILAIIAPMTWSQFSELNLKRQLTIDKYVQYVKNRKEAVIRLNCYLDMASNTRDINTDILEDIRKYNNLDEEQIKKEKEHIKRIRKKGFLSVWEKDNKLVDTGIDLHISYHRYITEIKKSMTEKEIRRSKSVCVDNV